MQRRSDEATKRRRERSRRFCPFVAPSLRRSVARFPAFTLTEIIVVISIMVMFMVIALPAINLMRGRNSVAAARNQVAAVLTRARLEAIAMQRESGVMFFLDPASDQYAMAQVYMVDPPSGATVPPQVYLDLVADRDMDMLPAGVGVQVMSDRYDNPSLPTNEDDRYLGYNKPATAAAGAASYGGVILFGADGQVLARTYAFRGKITTTDADTAISRLLGRNGVDIVPSTIRPPKSGPGFVLYDRGAFVDKGFTDADDQIAAGSYGSAEQAEETWLDAEGSVSLINRTTGALVKSE